MWIVDPLDGTRAFVKGRPEWVISIAAVRDGEPIVGVIFNPVTDEMFTATLGGGAHRNGEAWYDFELGRAPEVIVPAERSAARDARAAPVGRRGSCVRPPRP